MTDYIAVQRSITIDAPSARILGLVTDFREWVDWSPWEGLDPDLKRTYSGPDSGVGASYAWSGNRKAGAGTMAIESVDDSSVGIALTFTKPFKSKSKTHFDLRPDGERTAVTWQVLTPKTLMLTIMSVFMSLEKTVGPDLEKGLAQLKSVAEQDAPA
jgi:hypothetical protein